MAGLDLERIRQRKAENEQRRQERGGGKGPGFYKPKVGESILALAPPTEAMNGEPFVEYLAHGEVGPGGGTHVCLSYDNPILNDPTFQDMIEKRNAKLREKGQPEIDLDGYCPTCAEVSGEADLTGFTDERAQKMRAKSKFACSVMHWGTLNKALQLEEVEDKDKIWQPWPAPPTVQEKAYGVLAVDGDVTDPDQMVLLQLTNTGTGFDRYNVRSYSPTIRNPLKLAKPLRAALRKGQEPGGDLDPFRMIANFTKPASVVEAMLRGAEVDHKAAPAETEGKPQCFGTDCDPDETEWCQRCPFKVECAELCKVPLPGPNDGVFPFDSKTWADRGMSDPALAAVAPAPAARPMGRPTGRPAAPAAAPVARPGAAPAPRAATPAPRPAAVPAAAAAPRPTAAPTTRPAAAPVARPAVAPAARPAAAPLARATGAPAPTARPATPAVRPAAVPTGRPAAATVARPVTRPAARPVSAPEPDPAEPEEMEPLLDADDDVAPGPGEEQGEILEPAEGELEGDGEDDLDSFENELRGGK